MPRKQAKQKKPAGLINLDTFLKRLEKHADSAKLQSKNLMRRKVVHEEIRGETYAYIPLGRYVVSAPHVCRGRPTFKYTRIEVAGVLNRLAAGHTIEELVAGYQGRISGAAIEEAAKLAAKALVRQVPFQDVRHGRPG